jgi:hypothetical protein
VHRTATRAARPRGLLPATSRCATAPPPFLPAAANAADLSQLTEIDIHHLHTHTLCLLRR